MTTLFWWHAYTPVHLYTYTDQIIKSLTKRFDRFFFSFRYKKHPKKKKTHTFHSASSVYRGVFNVILCSYLSWDNTVESAAFRLNGIPNRARCTHHSRTAHTRTEKPNGYYYYYYYDINIFIENSPRQKAEFSLRRCNYFVVRLQQTRTRHDGGHVADNRTTGATTLDWLR